jgi:hypothetical protein
MLPGAIRINLSGVRPLSGRVTTAWASFGGERGRFRTHHRRGGFDADRLLDGARLEPDVVALGGALQQADLLDLDGAESRHLHTEAV